MQNISKLHVDELDRSILLALQGDARLSNVQLAKRVGLSESACLRRVKTLENSDIVDRAVLLLNQNALGFFGDGFCSGDTERTTAGNTSIF